MKQCHFRQHKNFGKHSSKNVFSDNSIPTECDIWILDTIDYTINGFISLCIYPTNCQESIKSINIRQAITSRMPKY